MRVVGGMGRYLGGCIWGCMWCPDLGRLGVFALVGGCGVCWGLPCGLVSHSLYMRSVYG